MIVRIALARLGPAFDKALLFALAAGSLFRSLVFAAAGRFGVDEFGEWRPYDAQALLSNTQAQIHVIEGHRESLFIQALQRIEDRFAQQQACRRNCALASGDLIHAQVAGVALFQVVASVRGQSIDTDHHAAVLHHAVGPQQFGSHCADVRAQQLADHFL